MLYVLNRSRELAGFGHVVVFKKDEPVFVPALLREAAEDIGAESVSGDTVKGDTPAKKTAEERKAQVFATFETIATKNDIADFDGSGVPRQAAITREAGDMKPALTTAEREALWGEFANRIVGDDDTAAKPATAKAKAKAKA